MQLYSAAADVTMWDTAPSTEDSDTKSCQICLTDHTENIHSSHEIKNVYDHTYTN